MSSKLAKYYREENRSFIYFELHDMLHFNLWDKKQVYISPSNNKTEVNTIAKFMKNKEYFELMVNEYGDLTEDNYMDLLFFVQNNQLITHKDQPLIYSGKFDQKN